MTETPIETSCSAFALTVKAWPFIAAMTMALCFATEQVAHLFGIELPDQANLEAVRRIAGPNWRFALVCAQVLLVMPVLEELVFRGLLYRLPAHFLSERGGLVVLLLSSALFSAAHYLFQPWPDAAFLALFFFGLAQCWLYWRTKRIWCAMINHSLFNATNLVLLFIIPK